MSQAETVLHWDIKDFGLLSVGELYDILRLRAEVFVVEQRCAYQDLDGADRRAFHLTGRNGDGVLVCYMRIIPVGVVHEKRGSLGRVLVAGRFRGRGIARELRRRGLEEYGRLVGADIPIEIEAQAYLRKFYEGCGFKSVSGVFNLDGLPHIRMVRRPH